VVIPGTVTDEASPIGDTPPGVARIWGDLDNGRNLEEALIEDPAAWVQADHHRRYRH